MKSLLFDINKGFSLVEFLVVTCIVVITATMSFPTIRFAHGSQKKIEHRTAALIKAESIFKTIESAAENNQLESVLATYAIHHPSILPERILAVSQVLVITSTKPKYLLRAITPPNNQLIGCSIYEMLSKEEAEKPRPWLIASVDGIRIAIAQGAREKKAHCDTTVLSPITGTTSLRLRKPFSITTAHLHVTDTHALPILDFYAIYLDQNNTLRRFNFIANQSQPIASKIESFIVTSTHAATGGTLTIALVINEISHSQTFHLRPLDPMNHLNLLF